MENQQQNKKIGIFNSDDFNDLKILNQWCEQLDKVYVFGNIIFPFLKNYKQLTLLNISPHIIEEAKTITQKCDILIPQDLIFVNSSDDLQIPLNFDLKNDINEINNNHYLIKDLGNITTINIQNDFENASIIFWYGISGFNCESNNNLKKIFLNFAQKWSCSKYIFDEKSYEEISFILKVNNCYYIKKEEWDKFSHSLDTSTNSVIPIIPKTKKEINTTIIDISLTKNQIIEDVSRRYIKQTIKESKRKRKKDKYTNLINEPGYIVEINKLTKNYVSNGSNITRVLNELDLKIKQGEFIVLFGKSGSGKSTLLNIISGLDRPTRGNVVVVNKNLPYLSNSQLTKFRRENLSFIFQQYHLLNNITGFENVETGLYLKSDKLNKENNKNVIENFFKDFELYDVINKYPSQMSGGQQQRISIIRALSKDAQIIFADEPTGALDKKTSTIVLNTLKKINKELGKTIIMVSHDPDVVKYATRVVTLEKGKIIKDVSLN